MPKVTTTPGGKLVKCALCSHKTLVVVDGIPLCRSDRGGPGKVKVRGNKVLVASVSTVLLAKSQRGATRKATLAQAA